jgi:hypothetical protein
MNTTKKAYKMNKIFTKLQDAIRNNKIVAIYKDIQKPDQCIVGKPEYLTKYEFLLQSISPDGFSDGYVVRKINNIWKVESDEEYPLAIEKLAKHRNTKLKPFFENHSDIENVFLKLLQLAKEKKLLVTIFQNCENDYSYTGIIKNVDKKNVKLSVYNFYGEYQEDYTINNSDISFIDCDTLYEQDIKILMSYN